MTAEFTTLKVLCEEYPSISYQRLNRAVVGLKRAGVISLERGTNNELRISANHKLLVQRLVDLMMRDFGVEKAISFLKIQLEAEKRVDELEQTVDELVRLCQIAGIDVEPILIKSESDPHSTHSEHTPFSDSLSAVRDTVGAKG